MSVDKPSQKPDDKTLTIVVNGRQRQVESEELSFDELVDLAFERSGQRPADRVHDYVQRRGRPNIGRRAGRRAEAEGARWNDNQCHAN